MSLNELCRDISNSFFGDSVFSWGDRIYKSCYKVKLLYKALASLEKVTFFKKQTSLKKSKRPTHQGGRL